MSLSQMDLVYVAGLFDGEGCVHYSFKKHWKDRPPESSFWIQVTNTDRPIIDWLKNAFGGFIFQNPQLGNRRISYCWKITNRRALDVLERFAPYLKIKRKQAEEVLAHRNLICKKAKPLGEDLQKLLTLTRTNWEFNKKGHWRTQNLTREKSA